MWAVRLNLSRLSDWQPRPRLKVCRLSAIEHPKPQPAAAHWHAAMAWNAASIPSLRLECTFFGRQCAVNFCLPIIYPKSNQGGRGGEGGQQVSKIALTISNLYADCAKELCSSLLPIEVSQLSVELLD